MIAHLGFEHISAIVTLIGMGPGVRSLMIDDERFVGVKRDFVLSYMGWGYVNILLLCIALFLYIAPNIFAIGFARFFFLGGAVLCVVYLLSISFGIYRIYHDQYGWNRESLREDVGSHGSLSSELWVLLPIYNIYRRYSRKEDGTAVREVVAVYSVFLFFSFLLILSGSFWSPFVLGFLVMISIARGIAWILGVDIVPLQISSRIAGWMDHSGEEICGTSVGYGVALWKRLTGSGGTVDEYIQRNKAIYRQNASYRGYRLIYAAIFFLFLLACFQWYQGYRKPMQHIGIAVVLLSLACRYGVAFHQRQYPRVPLCETVRQFFVS